MNYYKNSFPIGHHKHDFSVQRRGMISIIIMALMLGRLLSTYKDIPAAGFNGV